MRNRRIFVLMFVYVTLFLFVSTFMLVTLTQPAGTVRMPDVTGKLFTQVYNMLEQNELRPELTFRDAADIDSGLVLRQYPEPGKIVSRESIVKLVISRNVQKVEVPSLVGEELVIARNKLGTLNIGERNVSLDTGVITYIPSEKHSENIVIAQSPRPGDRVSPDSRVNMLVSMGSIKPEMKMPDVSGQHIDLVFDLLLSYGVNIEEIIEPTDTLAESGLILEQTPAAGSALSKGDTVSLKVAFFERDITYYRSYEKVSLVAPGGSDDGAAQYEAWIDDDMQRRIRFSSVLEPGEKISFVFYRTGAAHIEILRNKKREKVLRIDAD